MKRLTQNIKNLKKGGHLNNMSELGKMIEKLCHNGVENKALIDICEINRGSRVTRDQLTDYDKYPVYQNSMTPLGFYNKNKALPQF